MRLEETVPVSWLAFAKVVDSGVPFHKIVELAAPYAAFPDDMRKKADILSITRTWTFTRSDQLVGAD